MFRKIVSNLPYSPALVGQLGFYARRLRKEEATRQLGVMFTILALIVQSFAVLQPPTAANASSGADFIRGGIGNDIDKFLDAYDDNDRHIKDLFNSLGITRAEIKAADSDKIGESGYYNWSMTSLYSSSQGQDTYKFYDSDGDSHKVYNRPMRLTKEGSAPYPVFEGHSAKFGYFAIKKDCGNLITRKQPPSQPKPTPPPPAPPKVVRRASCSSLRVTIAGKENVNLVGRASVQNATISNYTFTIKDASGGLVKRQSVNTSATSAQPDSVIIKKPGAYTAQVVVQTSLGAVSDETQCVKAFTIAAPAVCPYNSSLPENDPRCQPCPDSDSPNLWIDAPECKEQFVYSKTAANVDQGKDAVSVFAQASDRIQYTLTVENRGHTSGTTAITESLGDVLEYSSLLDLGGGTFDQSSKTLTWPETTIQPGKKETRMFVVKLASSISAMNTGTSDGNSYDCRMINTFGNSLDVRVNCPVQKLVVEQVVRELPTTGPRENMIFSGIVFSIVAYFYVRARQLNKEVRLIRKDLTAGTI